MVDRDRVAGATKKAVGAVKKKAGKALGDRKLEGEGQAKEIEGDVQNTVGGVKDKLREYAKHDADDEAQDE